MLNIYSVKDHASKTFLKPFSMTTDRDAIQGFRHVCNEPDSPYSQFPEDFTLVNLGSFDEQSGLLKVLDTPITTARALDMKGQEATISLEDIASVMKSIELHKDEEYLFELLAEKLGVKYE